MDKTTFLLDLLQKKDNYDEIIDSDLPFISTNLSEYLVHLTADKGLKKADIIFASGLERTYAYQIFSGKKMPSRDKLIALSIGMQLTFDEVQKLFKVTGYAQLYPKNKRDNVIIFALYKGQSMFELNENLMRIGEEIII